MQKFNLQPIDKLALGVIAALGVAIGGLIGVGKACGQDCLIHTGPRVQDFSWQDRHLSAGDRAFTLTFNRPMDRESVEANLVIDPPLPGKFSWVGRRQLAYTLLTPIPYGETYQVQLHDARERFSNEERPGVSIQPYAATFHSRDRAFAYIGTQGEEQGRLIFSNLTHQQQRLLTPPDLTVVDFQFYPNGDRILFSAASKARGVEGLRELQLYTVATGVTDGVENAEPAGKIELILDNQTYQNNQFDLSPNGEIIVVQRVNRDNPADFDLWMLKVGKPAERLKIPGGDFTITPDSQTLAVARGEGISLVSLEPGAKPLDFLPKFGQLLSFSPDGTAAAMVDFNTDNAQQRYTRSLFYVNNQGIQKELLTTKGSILDCQFNATASQLYCLLTDLLNTKEYQEQPYFAKIDLKSGKVTPLAALPDYREIQVSLAPDGLALLFDQIVTTDTPARLGGITANSGETIVAGQLWMLIPPLPSDTQPPEVRALPLMGFRPQWLP